MKSEDENWEDYLYRSQDSFGKFAVLFGYDPFKELTEKGIIVPCLTAIRLMYTGAIDIIYQVNKQGRLVDIKRHDVFDEDSESFDPETVLSKRIGYGNHWEVDGIKPKGFSQRHC